MEIEKNNVILHIMEKSSNSLVTDISNDNVKFLIDKSILKIFGQFTAAKIQYRINRISNKTNQYEISYYKKDKNKILTALLLVSDLEYKIRMQIL